MLIFFDTEFTDLGLDHKLISIGLISENGTHEFYAELSDTYQPADCAAFVHEAVIPHLHGGDACMTMDELTLRLGNWIESFEQPVQLATDSFSWDWPLIQELFYLPGTWPENLHGKPASLYDLVGAQNLEQSVELAFRDHLPRLRRHHALDDAKANRLAYLAATESNRGLLEKVLPHKSTGYIHFLDIPQPFRDEFKVWIHHQTRPHISDEPDDQCAYVHDWNRWADRRMKK